MISRTTFTKILRKISSMLVIAAFLMPSVVSALPLSPDDIRSLEEDTVFFKSDYSNELKPKSCGAGGGSFSPSKNAQDIWTYLTTPGRMTPWGAAAIMGNISHESPDFNTRLVEFGYLNSQGEVSKQGTPTSEDDNVPDDQPNLKTGELKGQPGYGLVQWTFPSFKQALRDIVAERRKADPAFSAGNMQMQLDFLWSQLSTTYAGLMARMNTDGVGAREAARLFLVEYERPSELVNNARVRGDDAEAILLKYGSNDPAAIPSASTAPAPAAASSGCGGNGGNGLVTLDGYAFPLENQTHAVSGISNNQTTTTHHDETPAFDLYAPGGDKNKGGFKIYAIYDGVIGHIGQQDPSPPEGYFGEPLDYDNGYCYSLNLAGDDGWQYWYGHLNHIIVRKGDKVKSGDVLGEIADWPGTNSCKGSSGAAHLHIDRGINHGPGGSVCFNQSGIFSKVSQCTYGTGRDAEFINLLGRVYAGLP